MDYNDDEQIDWEKRALCTHQHLSWNVRTKDNSYGSIFCAECGAGFDKPEE
jgi:hypothetical protein